MLKLHALVGSRVILVFSGTKTLHQSNFNPIVLFLTLIEGYKCNKLYEVTPKKRFLLEPISYEKTIFKSLKFHKMKFYLKRFYLSLKFSIPEKFEIYFLGLPQEPFIWSYLI